MIDHLISSDSLKVSSMVQITELSDHNVQIADVEILSCKYVPRAILIQSFKNVIAWEQLKNVLDCALASNSGCV